MIDDYVSAWIDDSLCGAFLKLVLIVGGAIACLIGILVVGLAVGMLLNLATSFGKVIFDSFEPSQGVVAWSWWIVGWATVVLFLSVSWVFYHAFGMCTNLALVFPAIVLWPSRTHGVARLAEFKQRMSYSAFLAGACVAVLLNYRLWVFMWHWVPPSFVSLLLTSSQLYAIVVVGSLMISFGHLSSAMLLLGEFRERQGHTSLST